MHSIFDEAEGEPLHRRHQLATMHLGTSLHGSVAPCDAMRSKELMAAALATPVARSSGRRLEGIEGMRALAAASIVLFHVWFDGSPDGETASVGYVTRFLPDLAFGVTLFFTLSGFLLY